MDKYSLGKILEYAIKIALIRKKNKNSPRIRLISVCHFETVTSILQQAYGGNIGVSRGKGLDKAGCLHIDLQEKDTENSKAIVRMRFNKGVENEMTDENKYLLLNKQNKMTKII